MTASTNKPRRRRPLHWLSPRVARIYSQNLGRTSP